MTCPVCQQTFEIETSPGFIRTKLERLEAYTEHLANHLAKVSGRLVPKYECPDHPDAPVYGHAGASTWYTCGWVRREYGRVVEWCENRLETTVPI